MLKMKLTDEVKQFPSEVGFAWFFEYTVIYGSPQNIISMFRSRNAKKRHGQFIGVVKGLIPCDNSGRVLYEYHQHHPEFLERRRKKSLLKKLQKHKKDPLWKIERQMKLNRTLTSFR